MQTPIKEWKIQRNWKILKQRSRPPKRILKQQHAGPDSPLFCPTSDHRRYFDQNQPFQLTKLLFFWFEINERKFFVNVDQWLYCQCGEEYTNRETGPRCESGLSPANGHVKYDLIIVLLFSSRVINQSLFDYLMYRPPQGPYSHILQLNDVILANNIMVVDRHSQGPVLHVTAKADQTQRPVFFTNSCEAGLGTQKRVFREAVDLRRIREGYEGSKDRNTLIPVRWRYPSSVRSFLSSARCLVRTSRCVTCPLLSQHGLRGALGDTGTHSGGSLNIG